MTGQGGCRKRKQGPQDLSRRQRSSGRGTQGRTQRRGTGQAIDRDRQAGRTKGGGVCVFSRGGEPWWGGQATRSAGTAGLDACQTALALDVNAPRTAWPTDAPSRAYLHYSSLL